MSSPVETVTAFCAEWGKNKQAMFDSFRTYFTPTTVWENVGLATTTGIDEALGLRDADGEPVPQDEAAVDDTMP